ncbi:DNA-directed RNA polymerase sigma-70 factor [Gemmatimonadetes bacterium T265]|nr:DNA-directed RNA polymerase sigma-70 factor [Gemmatimonadetes bacterium T265]
MPSAGTPPAGGAGGDVTGYLQAAQGGDPAAKDALYTRVYDELRRLARRVRAGRAGATLSTTALVHEAYFKLRPGRAGTWEDRAHFFGVAARAMRDVLVDAARRRAADKRGGGAFVTLGTADAAQPTRADEVVALDEALTRLAAVDPRRARVVEFRFFAGLTAAESAEVLGVSVPTVERDWRAARAWLAKALTAA